MFGTFSVFEQRYSFYVPTPEKVSHKNDDQRHHIDFKCTLSYLVVIQFVLDLAKWSFDMDIKGIDGQIYFKTATGELLVFLLKMYM